METQSNVFKSEIIRLSHGMKNDLYDILNIEPAQPLSVKTKTSNFICDFAPRNDKYYVPKKKTKVKVKTVRDIRNLLEKDVYIDLPNEIEKQQSILLRKIRGGFSKDEKTKSIARNILKTDKPISRPVWQMIMNINPENHSNSFQFVLYNGKCIQINGSRGGKCKFICNYDIGRTKTTFMNKSVMKKNMLCRRKGMLQYSLDVKFKPGPLKRKNKLDTSYQKYHIGHTDLIKLPKPGLDIQPIYGTHLDTTVTNFINNVRDTSGIISKTWAEFAVSTVGKKRNGNIVQLNSENRITFDLKYKLDQQHLLIRHDYDEKKTVDNNGNQNIPVSKIESLMSINKQVSNIMNDILSSVEICLQQDSMYSGEDEPREIVKNTKEDTTNQHNKDKTKRKFGELGRLDVTVIKLPENKDRRLSEPCNNAHCSLGCVCDSLECSYNFKRHCGRIDCMFGCKCDFSKYKLSDPSIGDCTGIIPGLINLNKEINLKLSKEEQKFHQTVIVTDEKSILLKSRRRNWKTPKKYADFYSNMCLKTENKPQKVLSVVDVKLNCENIEPWCMVHSLYKCFCKGKFTESLSCMIYDEPKTAEVNQENTRNLENVQTNNSISSNKRSHALQENTNKILRTSKTAIPCESINLCDDDESSCECARTFPYAGRKYSDGYYHNMNQKILLMEMNDDGLRKKMLSYIAADDSVNNIAKGEEKESHELSQSPKESNDVLGNDLQCLSSQFSPNIQSGTSLLKDTNIGAKRLPNKTKLVAWLEANYKWYKQCVDKGEFRPYLRSPMPGQLALQPWDFILSRYMERKNIFMVSKQKPYRTFMAVDIKHSFFKNCINIDDIAFSDLHAYPITVKNLLTNASGLKDNFCILCGRNICWEIIGSVSKVSEDTLTVHNDQDETQHPERVTPSSSSPLNSEFLLNKDCLTDIHENDVTETMEINSFAESENLEQSKWFFMTIENDFSEIQFYTRGFFVKYESIIKAITVARASAKTVRLSLQKCNVFSNSPQFGIYAIPNTLEYCVFVGPYEKDEVLGIETIKKYTTSLQRTRGIWITTNKIDNSKVIDNPLSFMPSNHLGSNKMIIVETDANNSNADEMTVNNCVENTLEKNKFTKVTIQPIPPKLSKPIKIRKADGFYPIASRSYINKMITSNSSSLSTTAKPSTSILFNKSVVNPKCSVNMSTSISTKPLRLTLPITEKVKSCSKPVAEIAPQIKVNAGPGRSNLSTIQSKVNKIDRPMFILKPEEINERCINIETNNAGINMENSDPNMYMDIENFLANSVECISPVTGTYVISDDEEESENKAKSKEWNEVGIMCKNIESVGWIPARRNKNNELSFEFPGFKYTDFYPENEAFAKINQVLSRKVYVPKHIKVEWCVAESEKELSIEQKLTFEHIAPGFVMTPRGLRHKSEIKKLLLNTDRVQSNEKEITANECIISPAEDDLSSECTLNSKLVNDFNERSETLDAENTNLWNNFTKRRSDLIESLSNISEVDRQEITDRLSDIASQMDES